MGAIRDEIQDLALESLSNLQFRELPASVRDSGPAQ
jgi:hypothetical protein